MNKLNPDFGALPYIEGFYIDDVRIFGLNAEEALNLMIIAPKGTCWPVCKRHKKIKAKHKR